MPTASRRPPNTGVGYHCVLHVVEGLPSKARGTWSWCSYGSPAGGLGFRVPPACSATWLTVGFGAGAGLLPPPPPMIVTLPESCSTPKTTAIATSTSSTTGASHRPSLRTNEVVSPGNDGAGGGRWVGGGGGAGAAETAARAGRACATERRRRPSSAASAKRSAGEADSALATAASRSRGTSGRKSRGWAGCGRGFPALVPRSMPATLGDRPDRTFTRLTPRDKRTA